MFEWKPLQTPVPPNLTPIHHNWQSSRDRTFAAERVPFLPRLAPHQPRPNCLQAFIQPSLQPVNVRFIFYSHEGVDVYEASKRYLLLWVHLYADESTDRLWQTIITLSTWQGEGHWRVDIYIDAMWRWWWWWWRRCLAAFYPLAFNSVNQHRAF